MVSARPNNSGLTLAPYFFPTVSQFVVIDYFANLNNFTLLTILGFTTAFHLVSKWAETSLRQTDLQKAGIVKTILILPVMNLIFYGIVLAFTAKGGKGLSSFFSDGLSATFYYFKITAGFFV